MAVDWAADVRKYAADADDVIIAGLVRYCGIALQKRDSSLVSFSDAKETDRVRNNFLKKKLGLTQTDDVLDAAIAAVGARMKADKTKNRVTVYYLLAENFGMLEMFRKATKAKAGESAEKAKPAAKTRKSAKAAAGAAAAGGAALGLASLGDGEAASASGDEASSGAAGAVAGAAAAVVGGAAAVASGAASAASGAVAGAAKLAGDAGSAVADAASGAADMAGKAAGAAADAASGALGAVAAGAGAGAAAVSGAAGAVAGGAADAVSAGAAKLSSAASGLVGGGSGGDDDGKSGLGWLWWLLLALLAIFLIWWLFCRNGHIDDAGSAAPAVESSATVDAGAAGAAAGAADLAAAPAEGTVAIPAGAGVTSEMRDGSPVVKVYFDSGKTVVSPDFAATAAGVKQWLDKNPGKSLVVSGYNDPSGNAQLNEQLSFERAKAVEAGLVAAGIPEDQVDKVKPENTTDTSVDGAAARRVEVTIK